MSDSLERKRQNAIGEEYDLSLAVPVYFTAGRIEPFETFKIYFRIFNQWFKALSRCSTVKELIFANWNSNMSV